MLRMSKYANWSKEALIARVLSLEGGHASARGPAAPPAVPQTAAQTAAQPAAQTAAQTAAPQPAKKKNKKEMDFSKFASRRVALRFAYLGWNYHGLAYQKEGHRTVEGEILHALYKTRCIPSTDPAACNFSRCGRTDADVSAMAQVISLDLRSVLPAEDHGRPEMDAKELDYLKILNSHLPADILAYEICLRPPAEFDARFSCVSRHYRYYFVGAGLDLAAMQQAASRLVGEHDFRNFCKIDGSKQITNFKRRILEAEICAAPGTGMHFLSLRGTAFLWNQVRSIMAILFLVGQHLEAPSVVDRLLDVAATPRRPSYEIAAGIPLVLYNCEYEPLEWQGSAYTSTDLLYNEWHEHMQKQSMARLMLDVVAPHTVPQPVEALQLRANVGSGVGKRSAKYVPLDERPLCETPEAVNRKWLAKYERKKGRGAEGEHAASDAE